MCSRVCNARVCLNYAKKVHMTDSWSERKIEREREIERYHVKVDHLALLAGHAHTRLSIVCGLNSRGRRVMCELTAFIMIKITHITRYEQGMIFILLLKISAA